MSGIAPAPISTHHHRMHAQGYRQLVRASAAYDFVVTAAFATPWSFQLVHQVLTQVSPLPSFEPVHVLFANMLGSIVVVWSILRWRHPEPIYGLYDAAARLLFFSAQLYYLLAMKGAPIVWLFAVPELIFGLLQGYGYRALRKA